MAFWRGAVVAITLAKMYRHRRTCLTIGQVLRFAVVVPRGVNLAMADVSVPFGRQLRECPYSDS